MDGRAETSGRFVLSLRLEAFFSEELSFCTDNYGMFTEYFTRQSQLLIDGLREQQEKRGIQLPGKEKDLNIFRDLYNFFKDHLPPHFSLATGNPQL